jgi:heme-degrading monooxygenase HmoA
VISRQWRGLAQPDQAQNYLKHLRTETFPTVRKLPGFVSTSVLSRRLENGIEFLIVTQWESLCRISHLGTGRFPELGTTLKGSPAEP